LRQIHTEDVFGPLPPGTSLKVKVTRDKNGIFLPFMACMQFVFGKTSLASCSVCFC